MRDANGNLALSHKQWRRRELIGRFLTISGLTLVFLLSIILVALGFLPFWALLLTYFIPFFVALRRKVKVVDTLIFNLLAGWTIVFWILDLCYLLQAEPEEEG